jgi:DNA-binding protein HU-beta
MTKAELIDRVASRKGLPRDLTKKAVAQIIEYVFSELGDHFIRSRASRSRAVRFSYPGFGTFSKRLRGARTVRNPQNGDPITIPSKATIVFAPGQELKQHLNRSLRRR